ncbi:uncharacterized protein LOC125238158 [Leguminivora glycinivorella]|uniref:uncharacterized protein LOC125238158 n=1 Tax=Leguminivora glycinivorella TaxID=1035111 RepID=UPI00200D579A|nr:uncharacterized protein LOC125238158 [Leguminivora glycinivorella]
MKKQENAGILRLRGGNPPPTPKDYKKGDKPKILGKKVGKRARKTLDTGEGAEKMAESLADALAGSDEGAQSDCTLVSVRSRSRSRSRSNSVSSADSGTRRLWARNRSKRANRLDSERHSVSEGEDSQNPTTTEAEPQRSRGRPPTTGQYVGLAAAQRALNAAKREALELEAEMDLASQAKVARELRVRVRRLSESSSAAEDHNRAAADLSKSVAAQVAIIKDVAAKSGNLKGTYVKALKDAAKEIAEAFEQLSERTTSDETRQLQAANNRLQAEMADLREELARLRKEVESTKRRESPPRETLSPVHMMDTEMPETTQNTRPSSPPPVAKPPRASQSATHLAPDSHDEEFMRAVSLQVGAIVSARLAGLEAEGRLLPAKQLRPALAADKKNQAAPSTASSAVKPTAGSRGPKIIDVTKKPQSTPATGGKKKTAKAAKKNKGGAGIQPQKETPAARELPPAPTSMKEGWNVVASKGSKKKGATPSQPKGKAKASKLKPPRSAAVVLTLQPGAADRGVTYKEVMSEARNKVQLKDLDISGGLRFRRAATGACILEIPGASSGEKADKLADAIKQQIGEDNVRVSRPSKSAEIRVTGLDESVTTEEVVAAVARTGGCTPDSIKVGEIRQSFSGLGAVWVQCPVGAAQKVVSGGRLLVGWVSAQVKLLEKRPLRCYRCFRNGHVSAQCQSATDRSQSCFQCGKDGHKAAQCSAPAHCAECAAAGKPSEHRISSKACTAPKYKNRKTTKAAEVPRVPSQPVPPQATEQAVTEEDSTDMVVG